MLLSPRNVHEFDLFTDAQNTNANLFSQFVKQSVPTLKSEGLG